MFLQMAFRSQNVVGADEIKKTGRGGGGGEGRGEREACSCMLQTPNPEWEICLEQICFNTAEKRRGSIADVKKACFYVSSAIL